MGHGGLENHVIKITRDCRRDNVVTFIYELYRYTRLPKHPWSHDVAGSGPAGQLTCDHRETKADRLSQEKWT